MFRLPRLGEIKRLGLSGGVGDGVIDYTQRYFDASPGNLLALYRLNDAGATIADSSGNGFDGTYTSVTVQGATGPDGELTAVWDGINDIGDIYSAGLDAVYNGAQLTQSTWFQILSAPVWSDATARGMFSCAENSSNRGRLAKTTTADEINWYRRGGGVIDQVVDTSLAASLTWHQLTMTVDESGNVQRALLDGVQVGGDQGSLGAYAGALSATLAVIGAFATTPAAVWSGALAYAALYDVALTVPQAASLYWTPV